MNDYPVCIPHFISGPMRGTASVGVGCCARWNGRGVGRRGGRCNGRWASRRCCVCWNWMSVRWDIAPAVGVTAGVGRRARWDGMRSAMSGVVCEIRRYVHTFGEVPFSGKSSSPVAQHRRWCHE